MKRIMSKEEFLSVYERKLDFISRNAEAYQLLLDVGIDIPLVRLVGA